MPRHSSEGNFSMDELRVLMDEAEKMGSRILAGESHRRVKGKVGHDGKVHLGDAGDEQEAAPDYEEVEFDDWPVQGPRTVFRDMGQLRRLGTES